MSRRPEADLRDRVARLERENRLFRRGGAVLGAVVCVALLTGQDAPPPPAEEEPKTLSTHQLVIRDADGKARASFGMTAPGAVGLTLIDAAGTERAAFELVNGEAGGSAPRLVLHGDAEPLVELGITSNGSSGTFTARSDDGESAKISFADGPVLDLDADEEHGLRIVSQSSGIQRVIFRKGDRRTQLGQDSDGAGLVIRDDADRDRGGIGFTPSGDPFLYLRDAKGKIVFKQP